ncbi:30S ribosomal protein S17 [Candidatus Woesearchaeota archaeon]|nr:30S ribosomal protein S17 [Candidatus Woesearchaeota archaeon]MBW3018216.1 30S ribosomal protein S17 [Candidatus Woesearchaeota archaeon]
MKHNLGIDVPVPETECKDDKHCPFHGGLKLRGKIFTATVVASKMTKTATVQRSRQYYLPKYQRYEKRKSKFRVHNPVCINAKEGDEVQIMESRPISKTKRFVIIKVLNKNESVKE